MTFPKRFAPGILAIAMAGSACLPASATTLRRASLEDLVSTNATVLLGEVVDAQSHWNSDGSFILTDVRIRPLDVLKGAAAARELTITLMGGSVGDLTTLIVGGAELVPGRTYVLFIDGGSLPGTATVATINDHSQGVFEVVAGTDVPRAISQANGHPLLPDSLGHADAPGGTEGFPLGAMLDSIRDLVPRPGAARGEVKP